MDLTTKIRNFLNPKPAVNFLKKNIEPVVQQAPGRAGAFSRMLLGNLGNFVNRAPAAVGRWGSDALINNATLRPGSSAYSMTQPIRDLAPIAADMPLVKSTVQAGKQFIDASRRELYNPSPTLGGFAKNVAPPLAKTALNVVGATKLDPRFALTSAGIGGVFNTTAELLTNRPRANLVQSFFSGARSGLESSPAFSAIGSVTNPVIARGASALASKVASPLAKQVVSRAATGLLNIPEGIAMKQSVSSQPYNFTSMNPLENDAVVDFVAGVAGGPPAGRALAKGVSTRPYINRSVFDDAVSTYVRKGAARNDQIKAQDTILTFAKEFTTPEELRNTLRSRNGMEKVIDLVDKRVRQYVRADSSPVVMGIKGADDAPVKPKTLGQIQQANQNPDLTAYEKAMNARDWKTLDEIKAKYPGDSRFNVHERFRPASELRRTVPRGSFTNIPELDNPLLSKGKTIAKSPDEVLKQAKTEIGRRDGIGKKVGNFFDEFYTDWVNRFHPVEKLTGQVEKSIGYKIESSKNPIYQIKRLLGAGGTAELRHKKELEPIIKQLGDVDKSDFDVFMKAKRDIELAGRGVYGSDAGVAQERINAIAQKYDINKLDQVAEQLYTYQRQGLEKLKEAGFLSDESIKTITAQNQKYVPFERIRDEIDNYLGLPTAKLQQSSSPVQKIKGSDLAIESPLESVIANTYKIEAAIAKNNVAKSIVNLSSVDPKYSDIFTKVSSGDGNTIAVWENGKKQYYSAPREIVAVVKGLNEENMGTLIKVLSAPASFFRQQTTGRNLGFIIPNVVRDQFDAAINAKYGYVPFYDYLQGMGHLIKHKYGGGDALVEQWYKSGGSIFFDTMGGRKEIGVQLKDATARRGPIEKGIKALITGVDFLSEFSEKPTRIGVFKRALKATGDANIAAYESREATLDFARMGAHMKIANSLIPFLNVEVQGFDRMIRSAKDHPGRTTLMLGGVALLPQTLVSLYNNYYHGDAYALVPDFEKEENFIILTGGVDRDGRPTHIKIPKGHIQKLGTQPVDQFITWLAGNNPQTFEQFALSMISGALPIIGDGDNLLDIATRTVGGLTPQVGKPLLETTMNKDTFRNSPIVKPYDEQLPPAAQFYSTTPEWYKSLGRQLNWSPAKIQHLVEGYGGGVTKETNNLLTTAQDVAAGNPLDPNKIPIARRFYGSQSGWDIERADEDFRPLDLDSEIKLRELKLKGKQEAQKSISPETRLKIDQAKRNLQMKIKSKGNTSKTKEMGMEMGFFDSIFKKADKYEKKEDSEALSAIEQEYMDDIAKEKLKYSDDKYLEENGRIYYKKGDTKHVFNPEFDATPPTLTGNEELDDEIVKDYKSSISTRINAIKDLYDVGKFTAEEAEKEIQKLRAAYESASGGGKGKKKSIKGIRFKTPRMKSLKRLTLKSPTIKPVSLPRLPELRSNLKALTFKGKPLKLKH